MRSTLLYLLLVGAPLLGLLAILTAGEQLVPPHAIGGGWVVEGAGASPCVLPLGPSGVTKMVVSQSGPRAEATLAGPEAAHLSLELSGDSLHGVGNGPESPSCTGGDVVLSGALRMSDSTTMIQGVLSRVNCPSCTPVEFTAIRQPVEQE